MSNKENMQIAFFTALTDAFKDEDDRELNCIPKVNTENGNDLILAMFHAFHLVFNQYTGQKCDPLEFISILTRLLFQEHQERFLGVCEDETTDEECANHENICSD